nr:hypothetical protein [Pseudomonadota bacterium]
KYYGIEDASQYFQLKTAELMKKIHALQALTYQKLHDEWQMQTPQFAHFQSLEFVHNEKKLIIHLKDNLGAKAYAKALKNANTLFHHEGNTANITLNESYNLSAKQLARIFRNVEKEIVFKQNQIKAALYRQEIEKANAAERKQSDGQIYGSDTAIEKFTYKRNADKRKKEIIAQPLPQKKMAVVKKLCINWGEDYPTYDEVMGIVYPFPNPQVKNQPIVKNVFFGFIAEHIRDELVDPELFDRFEKQLAQGSIAGKNDAQGIRGVTDEIDHDVDNDYLFKINIGCQDLRLYGRKLTIKIIDDIPRVLICFDQLVGHKQELQYKVSNQNK